jgi:hypothetical protein
MRRTAAMVTMVLALVVGGAACSSSGGDDADAPAPTKAEFLKDANAICKTANSAIERAADEAGLNEEDAPDEDAVAFVTDTFIPSVQGQISDIRDLGFPGADKEELDKLLTEADERADEVADDAEGYVAADEDPFQDVNQRLYDYGLTECGEDYS